MTVLPFIHSDRMSHPAATDSLPPHQPLSATSRAAAESVRHLAPTARERVLTALVDHTLTDEEISHVTGISLNTVRPRRVELVREGRIRKVGRRPTESGRMADTWQAVGGTTT